MDYVVENAAGAVPSPGSQKGARHDESDTDFQAQVHESDNETDIDSELDAESFQHVQSSTSKAGRTKSTPTKGMLSWMTVLTRILISNYF